MAAIGKLIVAAELVWVLYLWWIVSAFGCDSDVCESPGIHAYIWLCGEIFLLPLAVASLLAFLAI